MTRYVWVFYFFVWCVRTVGLARSQLPICEDTTWTDGVSPAAPPE